MRVEEEEEDEDEDSDDDDDIADDDDAAAEYAEDVDVPPDVVMDDERCMNCPGA